MKHYISTLTPLLCVTFSVYSQPVHIPDPNLRAAVRDALNLAADVPLTVPNIRRLTSLDAPNRQIGELSGLQYATNLRKLRLVFNKISDLSPLVNLPLEELWLWDNSVTDLSPLFKMTTLTHLDLGYNRISDISPLERLTELTWLELSGNQISDITPLSNLTQLTLLEAFNNQITDVTPLANLPRLEHLKIQGNAIIDHSPLDGLALTVFEYDQTCDMPALPLQPRLENRSYPSIFTPWGYLPVNQSHLSEVEQMAQHDLYFCCIGMFYGLDHLYTRNGWQVRGNVDSAIRQRDEYIAHNPNMIFLTTTNAVWDGLDAWPEDSPYWLRDDKGHIEIPYDGTGMLDLNHPEVQQLIVDRVVAIAQCGLYDGVHFDAWMEHEQNLVPGMVAILKGIRERVREDFLILANTNRWKIPASAPYVNGSFFESGLPSGDADRGEESVSRGFAHMEETLSWAENNFRSPQINSFLGFGFSEKHWEDPINLRYMRAITTLSLTFTDGYFNYDVPGPGFYRFDFWDADLGRPIGEKSQLYSDTILGLYIREFTNGWAVYNHSGEARIITLPEKVQAVASGLVNTEHALPNLDGEMYLRIKPKNPADVNDDGVVNIFDLTIVAQAIGTDDRQGDVNGDGRINVFDLVLVANAF